MNKICINCDKISPMGTDICDKCGSMKFKPMEEIKKEKIELKTSSKELIEQEERIKKIQDTEHLCDSCQFDFSKCHGKPVFGIEIEPTLSGEEADKIIECEEFEPDLTEPIGIDDQNIIEPEDDIEVTDEDINPDDDENIIEEDNDEDREEEEK